MQTWQQWQMFFSWKSENIQWKMIISNRKWEKNVTKRINKTISMSNKKVLNLINADMAASAAVANVLLLKKRADDRQRAALRIKFEVLQIIALCVFHKKKFVFHYIFLMIIFVFSENGPWFRYLIYIWRRLASWQWWKWRAECGRVHQYAEETQDSHCTGFHHDIMMIDLTMLIIAV